MNNCFCSTIILNFLLIYVICDDGGVNDKFLFETDLSETYLSELCTKNKLCENKILYHLRRDTNAQFLNSDRMNFFKQGLYENATSPTIDDFDTAYIVYAVLDSEMTTNVLPKFATSINEDSQLSPFYDKNTVSSILDSFVYIGSGVFDRLQQHLYTSKAFCPNGRSNYMHAYVRPITMYICSQVFETAGTKMTVNDVYIYPLIAVRTKSAARLLEQTLIQIFGQQLINVDTCPSTRKEVSNAHFLAHFLIEYSLRFMPNELKNSNFMLKDVPTFEYHNLFSIGYFGIKNNYHSAVPKQLTFQNNFFYVTPQKKYYFKNGEYINAKAIIHLPFQTPVHDFKLQTDNEKNFIINMISANMNKIMKTHLPNLHKCYFTEIEGIQLTNYNSLKKLTEQLYVIVDACARKNFEGHPINRELFLKTISFTRRVCTKFEFELLNLLYLNNPKFYDVLHSVPMDSLDNKLPSNLEETMCQSLQYIDVNDDAEEVLEDIEQEQLVDENDNGSDDESFKEDF